MNVEFLVSEELIPEDGSRELLENWRDTKEKSGETKLVIYPDVHYKKGARVPNGLLICSDEYIYPACLGTENCGFTFGRMSNCSEEEIINSFEKYSKHLKAYKPLRKYTDAEIRDKIDYYLELDFKKKPELYRYLDIFSYEQLQELVQDLISDELLKTIKNSLGAMGGGNHFFEIHKIEEVYTEQPMLKKGEYVYILHSDSIKVGWYINVLYSNLSEMGRWLGRNFFKKLKMKKHQYQVFRDRGLLDSCKKDVLLMMNSNNNMRGICADSKLGRSLLLEHNFASIFGEMNRDEIIDTWATESNIKLLDRYSHSHDSVSVELIEGKYYILHRNGVQRVGDDPIFFLPSAMGNFSYIFENARNQNAFYSANHGTGRMQDKHIAKGIYSEEETLQDLENRKCKIYKIGHGSLAEQNLGAFKEPTMVIKEMEKQGLGKVLAKTRPVAIIKG